LTKNIQQYIFDKKYIAEKKIMNYLMTLKELFIKEWNETDRWEIIVFIGVALFLLLGKVFVPDHDRQTYSSIFLLVGILLFSRVAVKSRKTAKELLEKNKIIAAQKAEVEKQKERSEERTKRKRLKISTFKSTIMTNKYYNTFNFNIYYTFL
jgi:hypothetical protein